MSCTTLQEHVRVRQTEHRRVFVFVLEVDVEDVPVERSRTFQIAHDQIDGADLLLPLGHYTPLSSSHVADASQSVRPRLDPQLIGRGDESQRHMESLTERSYQAGGAKCSREGARAAPPSTRSKMPSRTR